MKPLIPLLLALACLTGCSLGSEKSVPQLTTPARFPSMSQSYQPIANLPDYQWWQQFHDNKLDQLVQA